MRASIFVLIALIITISLGAEVFPVPQLPWAPLHYVCHKAQEDILIDGVLDDPDWQKALWTEAFTDIEGDLKPAPFYETRVKMLWNDRGLYIAAHMEEEHIWAFLTERDAVIFYDNDFEVFIDPDGDTHEYYELEINALGTLWDLFLIKPYRDEHSAIDAWDIRGIEYAIGIEGTVNDPSDTDTAWTVEMLIPWEYLAQRAHKPVPPVDNDHWRINFSRVHWETDIVDGKYVKRQKPEYNWVWSPQGLIAMHYPERWGFLIFSHLPPGSKTIDFEIPVYEHAREYLRQLYYRQKQYWMDHRSYAGSLKKLKAKPFAWQGFTLKPVIETTSETFLIKLDGKKLFPAIRITEDGRCR
ncbi:MAG: carbohydrate-binding family 9-like protein [Candidatus Cloacimonadaceae bacterium]|nr:carbohydrate-binding family 9-like protein [Candidatus Cloacimonadaceae bacterium]